MITVLLFLVFVVGYVEARQPGIGSLFSSPGRGLAPTVHRVAVFHGSQTHTLGYAFSKRLNLNSPRRSLELATSGIPDARDIYTWLYSNRRLLFAGSCFRNSKKGGASLVTYSVIPQSFLKSGLFQIVVSGALFIICTKALKLVIFHLLCVNYYGLLYFFLFFSSMNNI